MFRKAAQRATSITVVRIVLLTFIFVLWNLFTNTRAPCASQPKSSVEMARRRHEKLFIHRWKIPQQVIKFRRWTQEKKTCHAHISSPFALRISSTVAESTTKSPRDPRQISTHIMFNCFSFFCFRWFYCSRHVKSLRCQQMGEWLWVSHVTCWVIDSNMTWCVSR